MEKKRIISILFSRYKDFTSNLVYMVSGRKYTHVSIALDEENQYFYSFNKKGFRKEYPRKHLTMVESTLYKIEITEEEYNKIQKKILEFNKMKDSLKYSLLGVLFCFLHIKKKFKNRYFCSQFIAELLEENLNEFVLEKDASLYFPNKLHSLIKEKLNIKESYNNIFKEKSTI